MAVDEHREDYQAAVWTEHKSENKDVEQRWFIGAHANVGGGYKYDRLHNIPLRWLEEKAVATGLGMKELHQAPASPEYLVDAEHEFRKRIGDCALSSVRKRRERNSGRVRVETVAGDG